MQSTTTTAQRQYCRGLMMLLLGLGLAFSHLSAALSIDTRGLEIGADESLNTTPMVVAKAQRVRQFMDYIHGTYRVNQGKAVAIVTEVVYNARKHDLPPELLLAIIAVESSYRANAVSHAGARGLMQIMPHAHPKKVQAIGGEQALFDPKKNIAAGTLILQEYLDRSDGDLETALRRYNGSLSNPRSPYPAKVRDHLEKLRRLAG